MSTDLFTIVADRLSRLSDLNELEARGTIRIAFKQAGLDVKRFGLRDLEAVFTKLMPGELTARGCADAAAICEGIVTSLKGEVPESAAASSDEIMRRLGDA
jgi:hypothetical protein